MVTSIGQGPLPMHRTWLFKFAGSPLAGIALAVACAACGHAGTGSRATGTSTTRASRAEGTSRTAADTPTTTTTSTSTPALPGTGKPRVVVGDKNYTEQFLLGQLYDQALTAQGFKVVLNQNIGPLEVTIQALKNGRLSVYPEYLRTFDAAIAGDRHRPRSQLEAFLAAQHYSVGHGLQLLAPTPFSDTEALAVTDFYATSNHLRSIGDLRRVAARLTLGGQPQFQKGSPGLPALHRIYGVAPAAFQAMPDGGQYAALNDGTVQAADVYTTDAELATGDYRLLSDPHRIFGWGNVVPVLGAKVLGEEGPAFAEIIERVDSALTIDAIRQMNAAVDLGHQNPADVAKQFLQTHGLVTPGAY